MVFSVSAIAIAFGLLCWFDSDMVFRLYEHDLKMFGKVMERTADWNTTARAQGTFFIILGVVGFLSSFTVAA